MKILKIVGIHGQIQGDYLAVPVTDDVHERLDTVVQPLPLVVRFLTGFPPRHFVRLDPVAANQ